MTNQTNQKDRSCQQHTKGEHLPGKVILASDLCCSSSLFSVLNRKTLKARCNSPGGEMRRPESLSGARKGSGGHRGDGIPAPPCAWPAARCPRGHLSRCSRSGWQFFLVSAPILRSFSSMRMHISARSCTCLLVQLVRAHFRHRRCQLPRRPGNLGVVPEPEDAPTASPYRRAYSPRAAHTPETAGLRLLPHTVGLDYGMRSGSARPAPSARRARTPARLPAPHRLFPPHLAHERLG